MIRVSVIIPTLGRTCLPRTVLSALAAMGPEDELLVVADGPSQAARLMMAELYDPRTRYLETVVTHHIGTEQLDLGSEVATGDWLMFLPDDDLLPKDAVEIVKKAVEGRPGVHVFACNMIHWGVVLKYSMVYSSVTGNQIVVPRLPFRAKWADNPNYGADHTYLMNALKLWGQDEPIYHDEVIAIADQENKGRMM